LGMVPRALPGAVIVRAFGAIKPMLSRYSLKFPQKGDNKADVPVLGLGGNDHSVGSLWKEIQTS